jgi:hypothetical protein
MTEPPGSGTIEMGGWCRFILAVPLSGSNVNVASRVRVTDGDRWGFTTAHSVPSEEEEESRSGKRLQQSKVRCSWASAALEGRISLILRRVAAHHVCPLPTNPATLILSC